MKIIITGGCGSIGKAFINLLKDKHRLIVVDHSEWAMAELRDTYPQVSFCLCDFKDYRFTDEDVVIHLAAYKHVDLGEGNILAFIDNNIVKTKVLFDKASEKDVKLLYVSTDKAVEPISSYGMTKFLGEKLAIEYGGQVARLGNIINSSGSVIPIWEKAIAEKKPIKITDPGMSRYVIEADDAVKQIWKGFLKGDKLIIPKMERHMLMEIVDEVLKKHGYMSRDDYSPGFTIIGKRPGEKINEKLLWPNVETYE